MTHLSVADNARYWVPIPALVECARRNPARAPASIDSRSFLASAGERTRRRPPW